MGRDRFSSEQVHSRADVAAFLQDMAEKLERGDDITLEGEGQDVTLAVPDRVELEIQVEEDADGEMSLEIELEWGDVSAQSGNISVS